MRTPVRGLVSAGGLLGLMMFIAAPAGATWMINKDVEQRLVTPQSNFETVLQGNATAGLFGGASSVTNPFASPVRTQSFDGTNTTISWSGSNSISQSFGTKRHFGIFGPGANAPRIVAEYWTPQDNNTTGRVPAPGSTVTYAPGGAAGMATGVIHNDSPDAMTISSVGYRLVISNSLTIDQLNEAGMPPGTFIPIVIPDSVLSAGVSTASFDIAAVNRGESVVLLIQAHFSGVSSTNAYDGHVREWVASRVAFPPLPGISGAGMVLLMMLLALVGTLFILGRRNRPSLVN